MLVNVDNDTEFLIAISKNHRTCSLIMTKNSELSDIQFQRIFKNCEEDMHTIAKKIDKEYAV